MKSGRYTHNAVLYIKNCFPGGICYVTNKPEYLFSYMLFIWYYKFGYNSLEQLIVP